MGRILVYLRRFKYVWLTSGLVLTAATLFLGTNPLGAGPRLWLGCCGFYFQPSEPLKLLLIIYLAAYLADRQAAATPPTRLLPLLTPTLLMTGLALLLLVFQRDLGTAAIFIVLYAVIVFAGTGNKNVLFISTAGADPGGGCRLCPVRCGEPARGCLDQSLARPIRALLPDRAVTPGSG